MVALQKSTWMLPVFSAAALLSIVGTALAFYASRLAWHRSEPREEGAFEWSARGTAEENAATRTRRDRGRTRREIDAD